MSKNIGAFARRISFRGGAVIAASLAVAAVVTGVTRTPQAAASGTCVTSGPLSNAYSVTLCITAPAAGATVTGSTTVSSSVSVSGTNPGVRELIFTLNGTALLWDFQSPYTWKLDSTRWVDGTYALQVYAIMRDGFNTMPPTAESLTFSNGITTPPVNNNNFTPTTGTSPPPGQPLVVAAVGDGASGETNEGNVANLIGSWNPNLFLYLGDVYERGSPSEF